MKPGDLVRISYSSGFTGGLHTDTEGLPETGIIVEHVTGRLWVVLVGGRRLQMDSNVLEALDEER